MKPLVYAVSVHDRASGGEEVRADGGGVVAEGEGEGGVACSLPLEQHRMLAAPGHRPDL